MKIRIVDDATVVRDFLEANDYPLIDEWSAERLQKNALMIRIIDHNGGTVGYIWATWTDYFVVEALCFHGCIGKKYRGKWMTHEVVNDLFKLAEFVGARILVTAHIADSRAAKFIPEILIRRYGFTRGDDGVVYKRLD